MYIKEGFIEEKAVRDEPIGIGDVGIHGDVVIYGTSELPAGFDQMAKEPHDCLAYGELTGHAHKLFGGDFDLRIDPTDSTVRHLRVVRDVKLRHQEHKEITLRPGFYRIGIQSEYDPFEKRVRQVVD